MSLTDGQQALIDILRAGSSINVRYPSGPGVGLPRYVVKEAGGSQRTATIKSRTEANPEILVTVEVEAGEYATESNMHVKALRTIFAPGQHTGVRIIDAPLPRPPLPVTDGVYSVPVIVRGRTYF
ncbi:MAG: hypothetical protein AAGG72_04475 [Pseudomonadota bacterium]